MCKRLLTLCFLSALSIAGATFLSGAAQAGIPTVCSDGAQAGNEECDDGNTVNNDGCDSDCRLEICGNGDPPQAHLNEECDDGNTANDDGCNPTCQFDCGDGAPDPTQGETCDDGNETNGDGCDDNFEGTGSQQGNCTVSACGNGVRVPDPGQPDHEECDDGNTTTLDGCDATCQFEPDAQDKKQQGCINAVNKNWAGVIKAQTANTSSCFSAVAGGKSTDFDGCFTGDPKTKISKAKAKTTATVTNKCAGEGLPDYALTDETTVNDTASTESNDAFTAVFGADPTIILKSADKDGAACQAAALSLLNKQISTVAAEANKAKKTALKGKGTTVPQILDPGELAVAIDTALAASTKISGAAAKIPTTLTKKKCTDAIVDANFDCGGATTVAALATCIQNTAFVAVCESLSAADELELDCTL